MTWSMQSFAEVRQLLDALCEETISPEQLRRLEELILAHPEAEAYYVQYMGMIADLARHFALPAGATEESLRGRLTGKITADGPQAESPQREHPAALWFSWPRRFLLWGGLAGLTAALLVALTLGWRRGAPEPSGGPAAAAEPVDTGVAVLLQATGAEWEPTGLPTQLGSVLPPGRLRLKSGFAQIEFYSGATVILEGPADFRLISPTEAYCAAGKLRAIVPHPAQGFTIGSPRLDLVDRGTEFGLEVNATGKTDVHVFRGKVELYDAGAHQTAAPRQELTGGRSLRVDGPGAAQPIPSDPRAFLTAEELAERSAVEVRRRQREWLAASDEVRRDPSLLVYYTFQSEHPWDRTLANQATPRGQSQDGTIVGGAWGTGRWPGKQGLEFKRRSDRVRFHVPGDFDALTLMTWVRVDALANRFNSLMMTDGWDDRAPHWHVHGDGVLELGVQGPERKSRAHYESPPLITPDRLGHWVHLAVVYDRQSQQVTHYVDGQPIMEEPLKLDVPLRIGDVQLGNWSIASHRNNQPVRFFSGCMDEFLLFSRALDGQEIERFYLQGRPPL
jgi:hypothetical protein